LAAESLRLKVIRKVGIEKAVGFLHLVISELMVAELLMGPAQAPDSGSYVPLDLGGFCPFHGVVGDLEAGFRVTPVPAEGDESL
jgi:hypothetical protein